jgi:hypothetical protein
MEHGHIFDVSEGKTNGRQTESAIQALKKSNKHAPRIRSLGALRFSKFFQTTVVGEFG